MQNKQDGLTRPSKCLSPLRASWKPCRQSRGDTSRCCVGLWGPAFDRGHRVTEWISSHWISCLNFLSGWLLCGRLHTCRLSHAQAQCKFVLFNPGQIEIGGLKARGVLLLHIGVHTDLQNWGCSDMANGEHETHEMIRFIFNSFLIIFHCCGSEISKLSTKRHLRDKNTTFKNIFPFLPLQQAPLTIPLWDCVQQTRESAPYFIYFHMCISLCTETVCHIRNERSQTDISVHRPELALVCTLFHFKWSDRFDLASAGTDS